MLKIRRATESDAECANEIYNLARQYMKDSGNPDQWSGEYPGIFDIVKDIADGSSYVCTDGEEIVGVFHFHIGKDESYDMIYDGNWLCDGEYGVIHRIAVKYHGKGIADFIYSECSKLARDIRIDTHKSNIPMQKSLKKNGFVYAGVIHLPSGDERLAFQKLV